MENEKLTVLMVEPEKKPYVKDIDPGLSSLQHEVGGYIQAVYPYEEPVALICDEEAKLTGKPLNRALRDEDGDIYDIVAGKFFLVGLGDEDFSSLHLDYIEKFKEVFKTPEMFIRMNGKIMAIPMPEERLKAKKPSVLEQLHQLKSEDKKSAQKKAHAKEER